MNRTELKTRFVGATIVAVAVLTSGISACSNAPQSSAPANSGSANTSDEPIDHGNMNQGGMPKDGMDHSMGLGPADAEFDLRFVDAMTPHHQGAVEMAKEAKRKSKRPEIQRLADNILQTQDEEIAQMKQWRQAWYPRTNPEPIAYNSQMGHSMPMSQNQKSSMMMSMDLGTANNQFDLRFINAMIPHHQGAVTMANDALKNSKRPEVLKLAKDIVASQAAEISQMQQWRKAWYSQ